MKTSTKPPMTYESLIDQLMAGLHKVGIIPEAPSPVPWHSFLALSNRIHESFHIPFTTITPVMRRLLFALGIAARPQVLLALGTHVGYAFAWLLRDRTDPTSGPFIERALGVDPDRNANAIARRNCAWLGHGRRLNFEDCDALAAIQTFDGPVDLLYLDLDDPQTGKRGYLEALQAAQPLLRRGALVLAHDPCVPKFKHDLDPYHRHISDCGAFANWCTLPADACGLAVAVVA